MAKHTLKIFKRFLKYVWPFFNVMNERVNKDFPKAVCLEQVTLNLVKKT